jgi:hypothetical protein
MGHGVRVLQIEFLLGVLHCTTIYSTTMHNQDGLRFACGVQPHVCQVEQLAVQALLPQQHIGELPVM